MSDCISLDQRVWVEYAGRAVVGLYAVVDGRVHVAWERHTDSALLGDASAEVVAQLLLQRVLARAAPA